MGLFGRKKPKSFEGNAIAACRRLRPDAEWKHHKGEDQIVGDGITINLPNLRLIWEAKEPDERAAWLEGHLSEVLFGLEDHDNSRPPDNQIRAMIRPRVMVESTRLQSMIDNRSSTDVPLFRELTADLVGILGVDSPTSIALVSKASADEWGLTFDELWTIGCRSVADLGDDGGWAHVDNSVYVSGTHDDYTNSRLVNGDYLTKLQLNGPAVVLLPHRNSLIVAPLIDDNAVGLACDLALQQLNEPSPICVKPFLVEDGNLRELMVNESHPAYRSVSLLRLIDDDINYKQVVPQLVQLLRDDLHVGGFFVDQDRLISSTNWGPTPALLPKADEIVFINHDTEPTAGMVAPWDAAVGLLGQYMTETEHYPTRYRVDGLPNVDLIRSISRPLDSLPPL